jgi:hypothetical protein
VGSDGTGVLASMAVTARDGEAKRGGGVAAPDAHTAFLIVVGIQVDTNKSRLYESNKKLK